ITGFRKGFDFIMLSQSNGWMPSKGGYGAFRLRAFQKMAVTPSEVSQYRRNRCGFLLPSSWILPT
ncbi:hypothetical protein, partial [Neisseria meningitidis]|uniref:hypothetical protein n=1 Tax=Neisseria meningitidis TaxID=487 RepID=UPI001E59693B